MNLIIELGTEKDIDELERLYNDLNDYLSEKINYPGWIKGIYPIRQDAIDGIKDKHLYTAKYKDKIAGTVILSHKPETAYKEVKWGGESDYTDVFVIHTFAVHPEYIKCGIGETLMNFALRCGIEQHMKAIRLDVYENNTPAIRLYEKCGYKYINKVDLGLGEYGLNWFKLYEKIISQESGLEKIQ
ncbi:MAG: GNAT family N-acetyltransferase [Anaerocolumna sp.]